MNDTDILLQLDRDPPLFQPGETVSGSVEVRVPPDRDLDAVELSILWYTEGKGDEDLGVHYFDRLSRTDGTLPSPGTAQRFATPLPRSPLSYDGVIIKIHWCVRVRVFLSNGAIPLEELPIQFGDVPPAREVLP
jgi:hypothetical protein